LSANRRARPAAQPADAPRQVLIITPNRRVDEDVFQELQGREDLHILFAATTAEAEKALREHAVSVLIASEEVSTDWVNELLEAMEQIRPGLPLLVLRRRQAAEPSSWTERGVGVLRCPLLPEALGRSVDIVLGLRSASDGRTPGQGGRTSS
jgi:DNA-binding NtrC family response regulator